MIEPTAKPKLPKGLAYPLKTSVLNSVLDTQSLVSQVGLSFVIWQGGGSIFEALYWMPNANFEYRRVNIRAGAVPADQRFAAAEALGSTVLPRFVAWIKALDACPDNSTVLHTSLRFNATWEEGQLSIFDNIDE